MHFLGVYSTVDESVVRSLVRMRQTGLVFHQTYSERALQCAAEMVKKAALMYTKREKAASNAAEKYCNKFYPLYKFSFTPILVMVTKSMAQSCNCAELIFKDFTSSMILKKFHLLY